MGARRAMGLEGFRQPHYNEGHHEQPRQAMGLGISFGETVQ